MPPFPFPFPSSDLPKVSGPSLNSTATSGYDALVDAYRGGTLPTNTDADYYSDGAEVVELLNQPGLTEEIYS